MQRTMTFMLRDDARDRAVAAAGRAGIEVTVRPFDNGDPRMLIGDASGEHDALMQWGKDESARSGSFHWIP